MSANFVATVRTAKGKLTVEQVKVARYRSGVVPQNAPLDHDFETDSEEEENGMTKDQQPISELKIESASHVSQPTQHLRIKTPSMPANLISHQPQHVQIKQEPSSLASGAQIDVNENRSRIRALALHRRKLEEQERKLAEAAKTPDEQQQRALTESESETGTESEEEPPLLPTFKPVFVSKADRTLIKSKELLKEEQELEAIQKLELDAIRRQESRKMVVTTLEQEIQQQMAAASISKEENDVDDADGLDASLEYEQWTLRELKRIKRDREAEQARVVELEEIERRREMTDAERLEDDKAAGRERFDKEKGEQKFMQRYYHKGAFFQDQGDEIYSRDYLQPTLEDNMNRELLPEMLQVKKFGLSGRTKWTHLTKEDTTDFNPERAIQSEVSQKMLRKMGGIHSQSMDKPTFKRRRD